MEANGYHYCLKLRAMRLLNWCQITQTLGAVDVSSWSWHDGSDTASKADPDASSLLGVAAPVARTHRHTPQRHAQFSPPPSSSPPPPHSPPDVVVRPAARHIHQTLGALLGNECTIGVRKKSHDIMILLLELCLLL